MTILSFTKNPAEHDREPQDSSSLADLFNLFPVRLKSEPADASNMVRAMERVIMSKHVENWADNTNLLGRIGDVYATPNTEVAETVEGMSTNSLDNLGPRTFNLARNDDHLAKITAQDAIRTHDVDFSAITDVQAQMAREARMIIDSSFGSTNENFTLVS